MSASEETSVSVNPVSEEELAAASTECAFVRICRVGQVPDGYVRRFYAETEHGQMELAVARLDGKAYATSNYCTHLDCLLSSGKLQEDGIRCSCHNSVFDLETGSTPLELAVIEVEQVEILEQKVKMVRAAGEAACGFGMEAAQELLKVIQTTLHSGSRTGQIVLQRIF